MLTIKNFKKLEGTEFMGQWTHWKVISISQGLEYYTIGFLPKVADVFAIHKAEFVHIGRNLRDNGFEYDFLYNEVGGTHIIHPIHCQYLRDPSSLLYWISQKLLNKVKC